MSLAALPQAFDPLADAAVGAIRRSYAINAERYDPEVGDDAVVFGIAVYRNSWYLVEQEVKALDGWSSDRPSGSLIVVGAGLRVHIYRCGHDGDVDLHNFRLDDERSSATQRLIAQANSGQLKLDLEEWMAATTPPPVTTPGDLRELVIVHAGNPDDGCCGVWAGAPVATDEITISPWAWIEPLWMPEDGLNTARLDRSNVGKPVTRHDELPEPDLVLRPVKEAAGNLQAKS